ncbi:aminoglycoside phosphotransferase (APT) family kinase protein [Catenulispora sp. GP43]|uniref:phosphotransferase family protein n=1 Tax=Catenulispora sp. GP43 TaxID=3156263 RepID=UPI00351337A8
MTTAADIARFTGPYNLPDGEVPVIDGTPHWPWDEAVARQRLARIARSAGLSLTGDEVFVESGSNDAWLLPEAVLRVCWRGDVDRLVRESELAMVLPEGVPGPRVLDCGRDGALSWMLVKRHHATSLWHAWQSEPAPVLHDYVTQLADIMRRLHEWHPPAAILERYRAAEAADTETDPVRIAASTLTPLAAAHLHRLIEHARDRPYVDAAILDRIAARLSATATAAAGAGAGIALPIDRTADVLLHADCTPANVLIEDGRIIALLDFEWSRLGPRDIDLTLPSFWAWVDGQRPDNGRPAIVPWLTEAYPALATTPERHWFHRTGFALRGLIHWPDYAPEAELPLAHPVRQLRHLADAEQEREAE